MVHRALPEQPKSQFPSLPESKGFGNVGSKPKGKDGTEIKKLTPHEIQYKRNNHLCFKCGDKFSPNHQCKFPNLNFVVTEEEEDEFEDAEGEQENQHKQSWLTNRGIPLCII